MDRERRARAIIKGQDDSAAALRDLAQELRDDGHSGLVAEMLTAVARRAIDGRWRPDERAELATDVLRDHQQFAYARRLLNRVRADGVDCETLRQQHALCTYKDLELPARLRLDRALSILNEGGPLEESSCAETLGIAGAICKRRWDVDANRVDLENALVCYRRGSAQHDQPEARWYAAVNAAFVADRLAALEDQTLGVSSQADALRAQAHDLREAIVANLVGGDEGWDDATLGEALFGLGRFDAARKRLAAASKPTAVWRHETTMMQIAALAELHGVAENPDATSAIAALVGGQSGAVARASIGKVGAALSGGGFRASLFHIGVLARLAECNVLRRIEVLSCVSGGSIVGAFYYLKLHRLLQLTPDDEVTDADYVELVRQVADEFLAGVRKNLRGQLPKDLTDDMRMVFTEYSRTDRVGELLEKLFYGRLRDNGGEWRMPDLTVKPAGRGENFTLRYENWRRQAKVPILVLNATTLNTGHSWQFSATWMGEPPIPSDQRVDASQRLRRLYYAEAPPDRKELRKPTLGMAVAASACVPGIFPPITLRRVYDGIDVELVDGGVHDNQGIASLVEQDCAVILVSDASGQLRDDVDPKRDPIRVLKRSNSITMKRVRGAQYVELLGRCRSGTLRGFMAVHLTKGLYAPPRDWSKGQEPWTREDDAWPDAADPAYGIDPRVQHALAELRTDLDVFSDDEAYALMAAGYLMTKHDLADALPEFAQADPTLELDRWPFSAVLDEMTSQDASRLLLSLEGGDDRFFRRQKAWLRAKGRDLRNVKANVRAAPRALAALPSAGLRALRSKLPF